MNNSLVSVIMPTYNQDVFIGEAIKFVLGQTCLDLELTIVDNYSEDETQKIVESFDDDCIRYFKFANNEIIAASRNQGIEKSEGKYIAFIDSDDKWLNDKLFEQINAFS